MSDPTKLQQQDDQSTPRSGRGSPLVFISHDNRDADVAEAFSKLLGSVSAGVLKSFRSSDRKGAQGIEYGVEWYPELTKKIESASDVVCLLTQQSLGRPWILYEAGVAKGKLDTPVHGIALGIPLNQANTGPFAQFQNCDDNEDSLTKLVMQLLSRIPGSEPDRDAVQTQVKTFKARLAEVLEKPKDDDQDSRAVDTSSVAKLFEEIKVMFQDMPTRMASRLADDGMPLRRRRLRWLHPMMLEDMGRVIADEPGDPVWLLLFAGAVRDTVPWLYELTIETYREVRAGDRIVARKAMQRLQRAGKAIMHGPWMEEMGIHPRELEMIFMELPMLLDNYQQRLPDDKDIKKGAATKVNNPDGNKND